MPEPLLEDLLDWVQRHHFGKYRGVVTDVDDPAKLGRIEVRIPAVLGDVAVWAMPCVPYAGDGVGTWLIPAVGAGVWVEFEGGDPSFPIWVGCFWGNDQAPVDGDPHIRAIQTETLLIKIDEDGQEVLIERRDGAKITLTDELVAEAGDASVELAGGEAKLTQGTAGVSVSSGKVSLNGGAFEVM
jgi:hypothetical protein